MGRASVSEKQKIQIETLLNDGQSQRMVAKKVGVSQNCVKNIFAKMKQNLPLKNAPGQGRKRVSTPTDDRHLLELCKKDRTKSSQQLSSEWILSNGKTLSAVTVRRRLLEAGYASYTAKRKTVRTAAHKRKRLAFANTHINWLSDDWSKVIWSDEAHFELYNRKNRTLVRRKMNESDMPFSFVPRMQKGGGCVSVWGCMTSAGTGPLMFYEGRVNGRDYIQIIGDVLPAFINNRFSSTSGDCLYMQDNAPPHNSVFAKKIFERKKISLLNWPPTSPDLNPLENLWDMIDNQLKKMHPKNLMDLKQMIEQIWNSFQPETCKGLVDFMPRRLQQCKIVRGGTMSKY
jgi:transposase